MSSSGKPQTPTMAELPPSKPPEPNTRAEEARLIERALKGPAVTRLPSGATVDNGPGWYK